MVYSQYGHISGKVPRRLAIALWALLILALIFLRDGGAESKSHIYYTAAHLPIEEVEEETGLKYLGRHSELDLAYYINTEYKPVLEYEGTITIEGLSEVSIYSEHEGYFLVKVQDTTEVYSGLSGTRVIGDGGPIGFVSEFTKEGYLKCITLPVEFR